MQRGVATGRPRQHGLAAACVLLVLPLGSTLHLVESPAPSNVSRLPPHGNASKSHNASKAKLGEYALPGHVPTYTLLDGYKMPALGLGVFRVQPGPTCYQTVRSALDVGYRLIDTAILYRNEEDVGRAVRDSGIPRSQIFITSKLWDANHTFDRALRAGRESNARLGLGYIDLYLVHSPGFYIKEGGKIVETYDAVLQLQEEGIVRSVGVSNFGVEHLEALAVYKRPTPVVNQFELHPLIYQSRKDLVAYCRKQGILVQAYGSMVSGHQKLLDKMSDAGKGHHKTTVQVLLRWALDQGFLVIPKSTHRARQEENFDVFDFTLKKDEIEGLNNFDKYGSQLQGDYWNPIDTVEVDIGDTDARSKYQQTLKAE